MVSNDPGRGYSEPLAIWKDYPAAEAEPDIEELFKAEGALYRLVVNGQSRMITESEAFDWMFAHGFEYIHLEIMLERETDIHSAYE